MLYRPICQDVQSLLVNDHVNPPMDEEWIVYCYPYQETIPLVLQWDDDEKNEFQHHIFDQTRRNSKLLEFPVQEQSIKKKFVKRRIQDNSMILYCLQNNENKFITYH